MLWCWWDMAQDVVVKHGYKNICLSNVVRIVLLADCTKDYKGGESAGKDRPGGLYRTHVRPH